MLRIEQKRFFHQVQSQYCNSVQKVSHNLVKRIIDKVDTHPYTLFIHQSYALHHKYITFDLDTEENGISMHQIGTITC